MTARLGLCFSRVRQNRGGPLSKELRELKESSLHETIKKRFAYLAIESSNLEYSKVEELDTSFPASTVRVIFLLLS